MSRELRNLTTLAMSVDQTWTSFETAALLEHVTCLYHAGTIGRPRPPGQPRNASGKKGMLQHLLLSLGSNHWLLEAHDKNSIKVSRLYHREALQFARMRTGLVPWDRVRRGKMPSGEGTCTLKGGRCLN